MKVKVKICGITNIYDALLAQNIGASALGFIFYPESKRYIEPKLALEIIKNIKIPSIGVFVNENADKINEIADYTGLNYIQLHGIEPIETCEKLKKPYIKVIRTINDINIYQNASYFLVDAIDNNNWGGTGRLSDWEFAKNVKRKPLILSGGLNSDNIIYAINYIKPYGVDISSGIEKEKGIKDPDKMKEFFDKIKSIGDK